MNEKCNTKAIEPQSHYEITSHPKTNIEPQRRGGRRDQRAKRFIYRADAENELPVASLQLPEKANTNRQDRQAKTENAEGVVKRFIGVVASFQADTRCQIKDDGGGGDGGGQKNGGGGGRFGNTFLQQRWEGCAAAMVAAKGVPSAEC
jgi:hypothetical protein